MKAVIIEDEILIAAEMQETLAGVASDVEISAILPGVAEAIEWFESNPQPDFVFMDIKLSDGLSFEIFESVKITCPVVFCTAYEEYAIRAFKANGVDYLLKPVQEEDLERAVNKVRAMRTGSNPSLQTDLKALMDFFTQGGAQKPKYKELFIINSNNKITPVEVKEIAVVYKHSLNYFIKFNGDKLIYDYSTLEEIEEQLDPELFFRASRQYIVNLHAIQSAKAFGNKKMMLTLKPPLRLEIDVSREKAPLLRKWLDR